MQRVNWGQAVAGSIGTSVGSVLFLLIALNLEGILEEGRLLRLYRVCGEGIRVRDNKQDVGQVNAL